MNSYADKLNGPPQQSSHDLTGPRAKSFESSRVVGPLDANAEGGAHEDPSAVRFAHDFSLIPAHSKAPARIQTKLKVSAPGDIYEQEADRVSEQLTSARGRLRTTSAGASDAAEISAPPVVNEALRSSGRPLDASARSLMESRFGQDFGRVRIHTDAHADLSNVALRARAFTYGRDIFFRRGEYNPSGVEGRRLLAHELTHTLQQGASLSPQRIQMQHAGGDDPRWFLKGAKPLTPADKTSAAGYAPNVVKDPFAKQKKMTPKEELSLFDSFLNLLRKMDKKVDAMKGDATQKVGAQVYGSQPSGKDSPGAKPAKNFIDLGSGDSEELKAYFDLLLATMGNSIPANKRQAMEEAREMFDKVGDFKDPQKAVEFIKEKIDEVKEIAETMEAESRKKAMAEEWAKSSAAAKKNEQGTAGAEMPTKFDSVSGKFIPDFSYADFNVPAENGKREVMTRWWKIYMKARDGSGLFSLTLDNADSTFKISTFGDVLYSPGGVPTEQIFDHYPAGYRYIYVGDVRFMGLLPNRGGKVSLKNRD